MPLLIKASAHPASMQMSPCMLTLKRQAIYSHNQLFLPQPPWQPNQNHESHAAILWGLHI